MRSVLKGEEVSMGGDAAGAEMGLAEAFRPVPCRAGERGAVVCSVPRPRRAACNGLGWLPAAMAGKRLDGEAGPGSLRCQAVALKGTVGDFL